MNDTKNPGDTTLSVAPTKTLTLKRPVEAGIVRQSFSHGRSKAVVVEKVKRRAIAPGEAHPPREALWRRRRRRPPRRTAAPAASPRPPAAAAAPDVIRGHLALADGRGARSSLPRPFRCA